MIMRLLVFPLALSILISSNARASDSESALHSAMQACMHSGSNLSACEAAQKVSQSVEKITNRTLKDLGVSKTFVALIAASAEGAIQGKLSLKTSFYGFSMPLTISPSTVAVALKTEF